MLRILKQLILFIIEICLKVAAPLAAIISMAASGGFISKVVAGFQSLPEAVREIVWWIKNIPEVGKIVDDYNTMTAATFNQTYGAGAVNYVMDYLNEALTYLQQVYRNLVEQPVSTVLAALLVFLLFYLMARVVRFVRQEGQGSLVTKFERRTGNRIFKKSNTSSSASERRESM
jgi:predicted PurR-regulated permease PerM